MESRNNAGSRCVIRAVAGIVTLLFPSFGHAQPSPERATASEATRYASAKFVDKVWRVAESSAMARGDLVAFLSEGTLVFASRFGKPALGTWKRDGGGLTMIEEGIPYKVEILALSQAEFRIRSHNPGGFVDTRLVPAEDADPPTADEAGRSGVRSLTASAWRLEDLGGAAVLEGASPTLEFPEAGRVAGHASCNRFFGSVEISSDSLRFGPLGSTRMACAEAAMSQEGRYLKALEGAERFRIDGPELLIHSKGIAKPLRFVRKEP